MSRNDKTAKGKTSSLRRRALAAIGAGTLMLGFNAAAGGQSTAQPPSIAAAPEATAMTTDNAVGVHARGERTLSFYNLHTEETLTITYWRNGRYDMAAIDQINHLLRDRRNNEVHTINTETLDYVYDITRQLRSRFPAYRNNPMVIEVVSGYRSTETLEAQRREGRNVAQQLSQHELGNAIDFRIDGISLTRLRDTAWCMGRGGVGTYRADGFVHVDTGRQRFWPAGERGRCPVR